jgi:hypothetical protein
MEQYLNLNGNSNVIAYHNGSDYILVVFADRSEYTYSYRSAGRNHVETMKKLARDGRGLNSYLMLNCKSDYEKKYRPNN